MYGYKSLQNDFGRLISSGSLNHAYLFYGEPETGKFLFAQELASKISNPSDVLVIEFGTVEGSTESVGIEKVRELSHFLYQRPTGMYRIAIIRDAHWLTDQAQNALLKILEEPPQAGMILATATDPGVFLPAVRSRLQPVFVPILPKEQILDFLKQYDIIDSQRLHIAEKAHGRIGRAKRLLETQDGRGPASATELVKKVLHATSGSDKKKVSDEIIEFFDASPQNTDVFIETLTDALDPKKDSTALQAICEFALNLQTVTIQKRIHIKKLLWEVVEER